MIIFANFRNTTLMVSILTGSIQVIPSPKDAFDDCKRNFVNLFRTHLKITQCNIYVQAREEAAPRTRRTSSSSSRWSLCLSLCPDRNYPLVQHSDMLMLKSLCEIVNSDYIVKLHKELSLDKGV